MLTRCRTTSSASAEPTVLELRVHGIGNTPPETVLDLPAADIERSRGDDLGSFSRPTAQARARDTALPPEDRHAIRPEVLREAYSWGAMARLSTVPLVGALGAVGRVLTRALWTLVIPFGLANAAYWARRLPTGRGGWTRGNGAAPIRLFSLALTLLLATSTASVSLGLVGSQCFLGRQRLTPDAGGEPVTVVLVCSQLPGALQSLARLEHGPRTALLSLAPLLVVLLLWVVSLSGRVRFDERVSRQASARPMRTSAPADARTGPVLATPGFWNHRLLSVTTVRLHVAASALLVSGVLSWEGVFGPVEACRGVSTFLTRQCLSVGLVEHPPGTGHVAVLTASVLLMAWVAWRVCVGSEASVDVGAPRPGRRIHSGWLLAAAVAVLVACEVLVWTGAEPAEPVPFTGLVATPTVLVGVLLGLAVAALGWRGGLRATLWLPLLAVAGVSLTAFALLREISPWAWLPLTLGIGSGAVLVVAVLLARRGPHAACEGWSGAGPGVFLLLSAGAAMVFSSLVVLGTSQYLNAPARAGLYAVPETFEEAVAGADRDAVREFVLLQAQQGTSIVPPRAYAEFGAATLALLVLLVLALVPVLWVHRRAREPIPGAPRTWLAPEEVAPGSGHQTLADERVLRARRLAATTQRLEPLVGALALACAAALLLTLLTQAPETLAVMAQAVGGTAPDGVVPAASAGGLGSGAPPWVLSAGVEPVATAALGAVAAAVVASMVTGAVTGVARPFGLVWDLLCFLPRAAHPFGPPCYAERVVPELRGRVDAWLSGADPGLRAGGTVPAADRERLASRRRVVLSAHSLGAVLAVAVLLARENDAGAPRIGLLTYGTQVRGYLGRFLPELLGPAVLGTAGCLAPGYLSGDPWRDELGRPAHPSTRGGPGSVLRRLPTDVAGRPAWVNLWRRTDPLGLPVASYAPNDLDRGAEEVDRTAYLLTVSAHSGYPRSFAYHRALEEVLARTGGARTGGARTGGARTSRRR